MNMPSSAELEGAAQELEAKAQKPCHPSIAPLYYQAAATYRLVFEERQTREALRAMLQALGARGAAKSIFEQVFGKDHGWTRARRDHLRSLGR